MAETFRFQNRTYGACQGTNRGASQTERHIAQTVWSSQTTWRNSKINSTTCDSRCEIKELIIRTCQTAEYRARPLLNGVLVAERRRCVKSAGCSLAIGPMKADDRDSLSASRHLKMRACDRLRPMRMRPRTVKPKQTVVESCLLCASMPLIWSAAFQFEMRINGWMLLWLAKRM